MRWNKNLLLLLTLDFLMDTSILIVIIMIIELLLLLLKVTPDKREIIIMHEAKILEKLRDILVI